MRYIIRVLAVVLLGMLMAGSVLARKKARKLPADAYIKSAKIEILSGKPKRYLVAITMLDSLFLYYGPHSEGLNLMAGIAVDGIDNTAGPEDKMPFVVRMVAYFDSLKICCDNKDIKKKYRKSCSKLVEKSDSTRVKFWRQFYNDGIEQLKYAQETASDLEEMTDSMTIDFSIKSRDANIDSCIANMKLALAIDPIRYEPYVAAGNAYEYKKDFATAVEWLQKGINLVADRDQLVMPIAYDYIRMDEYCKAIPYFREHIESSPDDMTTMYNLSACYNNCKMFDSAVVIYRTILAVEPDHVDVLTGLGNYHNQMAREANDSAAVYREQKNADLEEQWKEVWANEFDSSIVYFKRVFELRPDDAFAVEQYGIVAAIRNRYEDAAVAFTRLTELQPEKAGNWSWLGDCHLNLKGFDEAIIAYEKVVVLEPDNKEIWERLSDLYNEQGQKEKASQAEAKIKEL